MAPLQKLTALIIDPEGDSRARIRHALIETDRFGDIDTGALDDETVRKIAFGHERDVVLISQALPAEEVVNFIKRAKETHAGRDATFILVIGASAETSAAVGLNYTLGVDGFLLHPYSPDRMREIVELSFKVKAERAEMRNRVGLTLLVADLVDQINLVAFLKKQGYDVSASLRKLQSLCRSLAELDSMALETYFDVILALFPESPFPAHFHGSEEYRGLSDRVRRRMERKLVNELEEIKGSLKKGKEEVINSAIRPKRIIKDSD